MLSPSRPHTPPRAPRLRLEYLEGRSLLSAGGFDPTFGQHGVAPAQPGLWAKDIAVAGDGDVLVLGQTATGYAVLRYNPDGTLDTGFGDSGKVTATFGVGTQVIGLAILSDGRLVVGGQSGNVGDHFLEVARFLGDGTPDATFGAGGVAETALGLAAEDMAVFADGSVVFAGTLDGSIAVARFDSAGGLDPGFGGDGVVTTDLGGDSRATGVVAMADGKVVATGYVGGELALIRYDTDGGLDPSFGDGGIASAELPGTTFTGARAAADGAGNIVVVADSLSADPDFWWSSRRHTSLLRFDDAGRRDSGFGAGGQLSQSAWALLRPDDRTYRDVALQPDGKILVAGNSNGSAVVTRYSASGALDLTYGNGGSVAVSYTYGLGSQEAAPALAVQTDGKVVVASNATTWEAGAASSSARVTRLQADSDPRPARFGSAAAFRQHLIDQAVRQYSSLFGRRFPTHYYGYTLLGRPMLVSALAADATAGSAFSQTHLQVQGVDEGDSVKTDGRYLYLLSNGKLVILDAWPAPGLRSLSETALRGTPQVQYLRGNRLTVITQDYLPHEVSPDANHRGLLFCGNGYPWWSRPVVRVTVFDVSDRASPTVVQETTLDGTYSSSRAVGETVYVALSGQSFNIPAPNYTTDGDEIVYETEAEYRERLEAMPPDSVLPRYTTTTAGTDERSGVLTAPGEIYRPGVPGDENLVTLVAIDTEGDDAGVTDSVGLMTAAGATLYATPTNFYLISNRWSDNGNWTYINKISLRDGDIALAATGRVPGHILNQFSVSENGDYFYIATTTGWGPGATGNVYVLAGNDHTLDIVGRVENLAPRESIYSVRFLGDRAFVCTFERIDPLLAIDLSDPTAPVVAGRLEVTGYSGYLQAIDANHLIGIGREADPATGLITDLIVSLFDVSDLGNPALVSRYRIKPDGWAWSEAEYDFRAITWYPERQLLTLPVSSWRSVSPGGLSLGQVFQTSLLVFQVDVEDGELELLGETTDTGSMRRGVFIEDVLYSVSDRSVQAHSLDDLAEAVARVELPAPEYSPWWWGLPVRVLPVVFLPPLRVQVFREVATVGISNPIAYEGGETTPAVERVLAPVTAVAAPVEAIPAPPLGPLTNREEVPEDAASAAQVVNVLQAGLPAPTAAAAPVEGSGTPTTTTNLSQPAPAAIAPKADATLVTFVRPESGSVWWPAPDNAAPLGGPAEWTAQPSVWASLQADRRLEWASVGSPAGQGEDDGPRRLGSDDGSDTAGGAEFSLLWALAAFALMPAQNPVSAWQRARPGG